MKRLIKENKGLLFFGVIIFLFIVPIAIYILSSVPLFPVGGNNDWAGFWGGYLGAIIGAFVAIFVMKQTIENEKETRKEERQEKFLIDIVELIAEFAAQVNRSNTNLLRFYYTGEEQWNFEAVYGMNEVTKLENILVIKMLSYQEEKHSSAENLLQEILNIGQETMHLHEVKVNTFQELKKEVDDISAHLKELMQEAGEYAIRI